MMWLRYVVTAIVGMHVIRYVWYERERKRKLTAETRAQVKPWAAWNGWRDQRMREEFEVAQ